MSTHPKKERTLVVIKPDGVVRGLMGEVIGRFERIGLKVVAMKMLVPTEEHVEAHYTLDPQWRVVTGQKTIKSYADRGEKHPDGDDPVVVTGVILKKLKKYMTSGPGLEDLPAEPASTSCRHPSSCGCSRSSRKRPCAPTGPLRHRRCRGLRDRK